MAAMTLRVFLSSPGDVGLERLLAVRVLERLQGEFAAAVRFEPILWEDLPLRATAHFQEQIVPPSQTDIVVTILWSRLGTRLPSDKFRRDDGSTYQSGTEWEVEDAVRSHQERGTPDLFVYRKTSDAKISLSREDEFEERLRQKKALESFIDRWFGNPRDSFKAAFTTFETPDQFEEKLETHLRAAVRERLPSHQAGGAPPASWFRGSPFRRLEVFEAEHAPIYFGRTQAVGAVCEALARQASQRRAFVLVLGMSGCGKSSLVRAGVLPVLTQLGVVEGVDTWRRCIFRPGDSQSDPIDALAHALLGSDALSELEALNFPAHVLAEHLRRAPQGADGPVRMALARAAESEQMRDRLPRRPEARLAVVVDQLEEVFTRPNLPASDRQKFLEALGALARSGVAWVVATMRSDFYARCAELPELVSLKEGSGQYDLLPPTFGEIGKMIRHPAAAAGLTFEEDPATGRRLDEALHEAAFRSPEALPLLEFTLDELYRRRTDAGLLTWAAYRELGGLEGAIGHYAESVFQNLDPAVQSELPALLRTLVTVGTSEGEPVVSRRSPRAAVASTPARALLLDALIEARLLVTDSAPDGMPTVSLAHEAQLRHWERLRAWAEANRKELDVRARVVTAMERWRRSGQTSDLLLPAGAPLEEGLALARSWGDELPGPESDYIARSAQRTRRNGRMKRGAVAALFSLTVISVVLSLFAKDQVQKARDAANAATRARNIAESRRIAAIAESELNEHYDLSLILAVEAFRVQDTREARNSLFKALTVSPGVTSSLPTTEGRVTSVAFSPDGKTLAACVEGSGLWLWDVSQRRRIIDRPLATAEADGRVTGIAFSPDGKTLAAALSVELQGTVVLWDVERRQRLTESPFVIEDGTATGVSFSPDGQVLAAGYLRNNPHEPRVAGGIWLWDVAQRRRLVDRPLGVDGTGVMSVSFSPDGETLAATCWGRNKGGVVIWDARRRERLTDQPLPLPEGSITGLAYSPDGKALATGYSLSGADQGGIVLWDVARRKRLADDPLPVTEGSVGNVSFSPDGKLLAAAYTVHAARGGVVVWDAERRKRLPDQSLSVGGGYVNDVAFSPDGKTLVAGYGYLGRGGGGVVLSEPARRRRLGAEPLEVAEGGVESVSFSPDGKSLAAGYAYGKSASGVMLWDVAMRRRSAERPLSIAKGLVSSVAFSPDGKTLAAGFDRFGLDSHGGVVLWDTNTRQRLGTEPLDVAEGEITSVAFSPDGKILAGGYEISGGGNGGVVLWDVARRARIDKRPFAVTEASVHSVAFSPDSTILAAGCSYFGATSRGGLLLWDVALRKRLIDRPLAFNDGNLRSVCFSPEGNTLVAGYDGINNSGAILMDVTRRQWLADTPLPVTEGSVQSVAYSRDGKGLAAGYDFRVASGGVVLWNEATRERLIDKPMLVAEGPVSSVAFAPDGKTVAAGYSGRGPDRLNSIGGVVLWNVDLESWQSLAGAIANRNLTRGEWRQYFPEIPYHPTFNNLPVPPEEAPGSGPSPPTGKRDATGTVKW